MKAIHNERRKSSLEASFASQFETRDIVKNGVRLQKCIGTIGAIEYLKSQGVMGAVITRVLSGGSMRESDRTVSVPDDLALPLAFSSPA